MMRVMLYIKDLFFQTMGALGTSFQHNWKILLFAIVLAVILKTYVNSDKLSRFLFNRKKISVIASVLFGAFTPLCACGTTAVIIGMLTTTFPWSPVMAFLTSSPLMSPDGFVLISGVIGLKFAIALTVTSIIIGITAGFITNIIEKKTDFLKNQSRFIRDKKIQQCGCTDSAPVKDCTCNISSEASECACSQVISNNESRILNIVHKYKLKQLANEFIQLGLKQILLFYSIFICIGYLINYFIPSSIITVIFGANSFYAVPLASIIGLPLYITTESGTPIILSMIQSGASQGAMLAFIITGSATSAWVIAGLTSFMKRRAIALYVTFILVGGIVAGYLFDLINYFY